MSDASSHCRIELAADRHGSVLMVGGALLAASAITLTGLDGPLALGAWLTAAAIVGLQWRRRRGRPQALLLRSPDQVELQHAARPAEAGQLRGWRRLGPLLILDIEVGRRMQFDLWLPALPLNASRELMRQLARMQPGAEPSV